MCVCRPGGRGRGCGQGRVGRLALVGVAAQVAPVVHPVRLHPVAIALDEANRSGAFKRGDNIVLVVFGAGLTWAAAAVRW